MMICLANDDKQPFVTLIIPMDGQYYFHYMAETSPFDVASMTMIALLTTQRQLR